MGKTSTLTFAGAALAAALLIGAPGWASGPGTPAPWSVDQFHGDAKDLRAFYNGRVGIVMARTPRPMLFIDWRLLHGGAVGAAIGAPLSTPCCNPGRFAPGDARPTGREAWLIARKRVAGAGALPDYLSVERPGPDNGSVANCFDDAFDTAVATLDDRITRFGARSPDVAAWLTGQDAVFSACSVDTVMPALRPDAPAWLREDHAYQSAALALYNGQLRQAAADFTAIAGDPQSPWRRMAPYLRARADLRAALKAPGSQTEADARAAIDQLAAAPAGAYGQDRVKDLRRILDFRYRPAALLAALDRALNADPPPADAAVAFRDLSDLSDAAARKPDMMDWMATLAAQPPPSARRAPPPVPGGVQRLYDRARDDARTHAEARWRATRDPAWLIAALGTTSPDAPSAAALLADADKVGPDHPAWLSLQYQSLRLRLASGDPGALRRRLDALLRRDLSVSDRNVLLAMRLELAENGADFVRFALRRRLCPDLQAAVPRPPSGCVRGDWDSDDYQPGGVFDGAGASGTVGLGEDARAVIDRLPLAARMRIGADPRLPARLRLDIDLTSYARAVALQDDAAIDRLAARLTPLLPVLGADWRRIPAARAGPAKRFAEFQILAKIPGLRFDLVRYTRPEGRSAADFQKYWMPWFLLPHGDAAAAAPPAFMDYQTAGFLGPALRDVLDRGDGSAGPVPADRSDLVCLGECQPAASPMRLPAFAESLHPEAQRQRRFFLDTERAYGRPAVTPPTGAVSVWDEMLNYIGAHPDDPRAPETLHWLVHVGRFGGSHDGSGHRAFDLLHRRYPASVWAKRTPYFYD